MPRDGHDRGSRTRDAQTKERLRRGVRAEHDSLGTVLRLVRAGEAVTRPELEQRSGLGRATIADRVATLIERGLLEEGALKSSSVGRSPRQLRFRAEAGVVLVAYARTTTLGVAIADLAGNLLVEHHEPSDIAAGPARTLDRLTALFDWVLEEHQEGRPVWAITIALPTPVEQEQAAGTPFGTSVIHGLPNWEGFPVGQVLTKRYGVPVWLDTDAHLMALAELRAGRGVGSRDLLFIKIGTGIAAGLCSGGEVHRGAQGAAGSIGHMPAYDAPDVRCVCGKSGCLEAIAGGRAIGEAGRRAATDGSSRVLADVLAETGDVTSVDVAGAAQGGDPAAIEILSSAGHAIGAVLASLVNFYNPPLVVVGGGVAQTGDILLAAIRETVYRRSLPLTTRELRIVRTSLGHTASLVGAALMAADTFFEPDTLTTWIETGAPMASPDLKAVVEQLGAGQKPAARSLPPPVTAPRAGRRPSLSPLADTQGVRS